MSTNRFLSSESTGNLTGGTTTIFGATIGADNLLASKPLKTDSLKTLISTNLDISDINQLQTTLDNLGDAFVRNAPLVAFKNAGDKLAVDIYRTASGTGDMVHENTIDAQDNIKTDQISESTGAANITMNQKTIHVLGIQDSTLTASSLIQTDGTKKLISTDLATIATGGTNISLVGNTINSDNIQSLNVADTPTFTGLLVSGLTASKLVETNGTKNLVSVTDLSSHFTAGTKISITGTDPLTINNTSVFGDGFQQASSDGIFSTMSTTFVEKLKMSVPTLPSGTYRISWSIEIENDLGAGGQFRVQEDDTTDLGFGFIDNSTQPEKIAASGFIYLTAYTGGTDIDIDIKATTGTTEVQNARLEIWRVS